MNGSSSGSSPPRWRSASTARSTSRRGNDAEIEVRLAISDLRSALARPAASRKPTTTLEDLLRRLVRSDPVDRGRLGPRG